MNPSYRSPDAKIFEQSAAIKSSTQGSPCQKFFPAHCTCMNFVLDHCPEQEFFLARMRLQDIFFQNHLTPPPSKVKWLAP